MHNDSATISNPNINANITVTDTCECSNCRYKSIGFICRHGAGHCMKTDVIAMQNRSNTTTLEMEKNPGALEEHETPPSQGMTLTGGI
ncbi:MAG: hypothetical protein RSG55_06765 [Oscillospiraceae bacterium]